MPPSLHRSDSQSTDSAGSAGVDELTAVFAAGHVESIVDGLLRMRDALARDSPDTAHICFLDTLPDMLAASAHPFTLVLQLIDADALARRPVGKVDLRTLLVRSLRSCCISERVHSLDLAEATAAAADGPEDQSPPPAELTPALTEQARELCLRLSPAGPFLSPRTVEAVLSLYRVNLSQRELIAYARCCFDARQYRDAAEFLRMFRIEAEEPSAEELAAGTAQLTDGFPHDALLLHLSSDKQHMDVFLAYLSQSPAFLARHVHAALTHLAEHSGGNDPNLAAKLVLKFGLQLSDFPRVTYLKKKDIVWWICRVGKATDWGLLLCGDDLGLQRKLLRELQRSRHAQDHVLACSFLEQWRHHLQEPEFAQLYEQQRLALQHSQPHLTHEQRFQAQLDAALRLHAESAPAASSVANPPSLLLRALPSTGPNLPLLLLHPRHIVFVDSMSSLAEARAHLTAPGVKALGLDLEFVPDNMSGLGITPVQCQLLQIACDTKCFLFDLARLHVDASVENGSAASAASAASSVAASASDAAVNSVASSSDAAAPCFFPPLPAASPAAPAPPCEEFIRGVDDLLMQLVLDESVLKLGIGFAQDLRKLRTDFPHVMAFQITLQNYADLTPLLKLVEDPDASAREGARRKQKSESKRRAAERRQRAKNNNTSAPSNPTPAAAAPAKGLSSLFGGGDDDDEDDDGPDSMDAGAAADATATDVPAGLSAASPSPAPSASPPTEPTPPAAAALDSSLSAASAAPHPPRFGGGFTNQAAPRKEGGLSKLCRMMLRRTLDKSEQISNWSRRPLSTSQTQYAALDAYVALLLLREANARGIELDTENIEAGAL